MDYSFDDTEAAFQTELRRFSTNVLAPHYQSDDRAGEMRPTLLSDMASMGLTGLRIPTEFGGQEASQRWWPGWRPRRSAGPTSTPRT